MRPGHRRRLSLAVPLVAMVVGIVAVLVGSSLRIEYRREADARRADLDRGLQVAADQLAEALVLPMWNLDDAHIRGIAASGLLDREVVAIEVVSNEQRLVLGRDAGGAVATLPAPPSDPALLVTERTVSHEGEAIGRVRVSATTALLDRRLAEWRAAALRLGVLLATGLSAGMLFFLWWLVLRPVKALDRYAEQIEQGGAATLAPARFVGELGALRTSIGLMLGMLETRYRELREGEARLQLATRSASIGIWHWAIASDRWSGDDQAGRILGCPGPFGGTRADWLARLEPASAAQAARALDEALAGANDDSFSGEFRVRGRDGATRLVKTEATVQRGPDGAPTHVVGVHIDVTAQRAAEDEIRALNTGLEQRVAERTAQLMAALDEGVRARERAESATRAKSEFLANMSHEIRTPMNAVLGMTDLALRGELGERQRGYLTRAKAAADSLLVIINDILDFSKIEAGKLRMHAEAFALEAVLQRVASVAGVRAHEKALPLRVRVAPDVPARVVGDATRLEQVLLNLVSNAVKFTERGEVEMRVECTALPAAAAADTAAEGAIALRFTVRDTGIGMTPAQQAELFQPFNQLDASTTRKYGGTGLGLAISRRLVELMDGTIEAASTPGVGSEFHFTAVFAPAPPEDARPPASAQGAAQAPDDALRGRRVLLVEDNELNQIVASELLGEVAGLDVTLAADGPQALAALAGGEAFDAVLMDVQMPGMDGYEVTRRLRADPRHADVPVIAMTAHARDEDRERCIAAGMNDFVSKPFEPAQLFAVLARWLTAAGPR